MTTKPIALKIASDEFMKNFNPDFLSQFEVIPWNRKFGPKDSLPYAEGNRFSAVFVDADLTYSTENLRSWARLLTGGGMLALEAVRHNYPNIIEHNNPYCLKYLHNPSEKIWLFSRPVRNIFNEKLDKLLQALEENTDLNNILTLINALEQSVQLLGNVGEFPLIKARIYKKYGLLQPALDAAQHYADRSMSTTAQLNSWLVKLGCYEYQMGFAERKAYLERADFKRASTVLPKSYASKEWKGESIEGKTLFVTSEFGLGDEIMFTQLAHYLKSLHPKKLIFMVQPPNVELVSSHPDIDQVVSTADIERLPEFDYFVYPHDILIYCNRPFKDVPKRHPYLTPDPQKVAEFAPHFPNNGKLKIGIVWRGNPSHENDKGRSIHDTSHLESLFAIQDIDWYCFQKICNEKDVELLEKYQIPHITKDFNTLADTAAALKHVDYLLTVDTSVAHVAGAIGTETLLTLPNFADWRWGLDESESLWYPSLRILRNPKMFTDDWSKLIELLHLELKKLILQHQQRFVK